ncbi:hypothetical protein SLEP1_g31752 [Rubroshorea leprosula]|uniref:Uncharacterized protein n=2 Tax=Rubroshorea leprosula TaxID=152421 RepID=A0AAV5KBA7_9ROSI|nr:hypothetical protein SLEP1_g31752 [Rubroshorea leprosula]
MEGNALPTGYSNEMGTPKEVPLREITSAHVGASSWWLTLKPFVNAGLAQTIRESMKVTVIECFFHFPSERFQAELKEPKEQYMVIRKHIPQIILSSSLMKIVSVGSYEVLKKQVANARGMPLTLYQDACCGLLAGSIGAYICAPLTAARISIYADSKRPAAKRVNYRSLFDAMYRIGASEGLPALWKRSAASVKGMAAYHASMLPTYNLSKEFCRVDFAFDESKAQLGNHTLLYNSSDQMLTC